MRLVVDTNVFDSAALKEASWPSKTIRWIGKFGGLLKTVVTEKEVLDVLQRPRIAPKPAKGGRRLRGSVHLARVAAALGSIPRTDGR
jgi:hypothetical protein